MTLRLPAAARRVHDAVTGAVAGATALDAGAVDEHVRRLGLADTDQVHAVLHELVLRLLERSHPDGLDADSVRELLDGVLQETAAWLPDLDPHALVLVLGGALSALEEGTPPAEHHALLMACVVLVAHLLAVLEEPLAPSLDAAFAELHRAQTVELP